MKKLILAIFVGACMVVSARIVYVPGWGKTNSPHESDWSACTNAFSGMECSFHSWNGNVIWPHATKNADAEAVAFAEMIESMTPEMRSELILVGHSLGGRIVAHTLAKLARDGYRVRQGILLAAAIPCRDSDLAQMGAGSELPVIALTNPQDVTLKYVYTIAGGEDGPSFGTNGSPTPLEHVIEYAVPSDITETTKLVSLWAKSDVLKRIANHHSPFYFAELRRILDGEPSANPQMRVIQGLPNLELSVPDLKKLWKVLDESNGWKLEANVITGHCRILNDEKVRVAWGDEQTMRVSFDKVKQQQNGSVLNGQ